MEVSLPGTGTLGWGAASCGVRIPCSSEATSTAEISLPIFNSYTWVWYPYDANAGTLHVVPSVSLTLLPLSMWLLLYVLSCSARLQGVFSDGCSEFSCNFDVVVGGGKHSVYLLLHLERKPRIAFCFRR